MSAYVSLTLLLAAVAIQAATVVGAVTLVVAVVRDWPFQALTRLYAATVAAQVAMLALSAASVAA